MPYFRLLGDIMTDIKPAVEFRAGDFCPQSAQSSIESVQQKGQIVLLNQELVNVRSENWGKTETHLPLFFLVLFLIM